MADPGRVLAPLLRAALDNALRLGDAALTGPVSRGDAGTVARHLDRDGGRAGSVPAYLALARRTADRAIAAGRLRPQDAEPAARRAGPRRPGECADDRADPHPRGPDRCGAARAARGSAAWPAGSPW